MSTTTETAQNDTTTQHVKREALNPLLTAFVVTGFYYFTAFVVTGCYYSSSFYYYLNRLLTAFVVTASVLIILANGLLCVFLRKDRRLWFQVSSKIIIQKTTRNDLSQIFSADEQSHVFSCHC